MPQNKNHWYDGWFYDSFIAPNQDKLFEKIKDYIEPDSKVIDVGCGTGRFSFYIADKCQYIFGIDLSSRNIKMAVMKLKRNPNSKIFFQHKNIDEIISENNIHFDYAVLTYVIHEVAESERINLLNKIFLTADKIIIGDYLVPKQPGYWGLLNEAVEFAAGSDHYRNYKNFIANGGINGLAIKAGFKIITEIKNQPSTSHLVVLAK
ncbi:MAG: class I SAM-dependent methyltransferase [Ignavibacteriaceae bacterium]